MKTILSVDNLKTYFYTEEGVVRAVDGVSFLINKGETLGLVGESGSGKTVTALSIMGLINPPGKIVGGKILLEGEDLTQKNKAEMREIRKRKISMIFQDPMASLNPVLSIGKHMVEAIPVDSMTKSELGSFIQNALEEVGISNPLSVKQYPHQLSAGMRQRVMMAMALCRNPECLIADEATTNLDVTIQAQVLEMMKQLSHKYQSSILLITHNMGVVAEMCDSVAVMYAGKIMEYGDVFAIFETPMHPYTKALIDATMSVRNRKKEFPVIPGRIPNLINPPVGCRFHPRCKYKKEICERREPKLFKVANGHMSSCWLVGE